MILLHGYKAINFRLVSPHRLVPKTLFGNVLLEALFRKGRLHQKQSILKTRSQTEFENEARRDDTGQVCAIVISAHPPVVYRDLRPWQRNAFNPNDLPTSRLN